MIKEEFKKYNLFKIFLSFVLCFTISCFLKLINHYDSISFLFGMITYTLYSIIVDYKKNDIK